MKKQGEMKVTAQINIEDSQRVFTEGEIRDNLLNFELDFMQACLREKLKGEKLEERVKALKKEFFINEIKNQISGNFNEQMHTIHD
jgi:hypothetical protein